MKMMVVQKSTQTRVVLENDIATRCTLHLFQCNIQPSNLDGNSSESLKIHNEVRVLIGIFINSVAKYDSSTSQCINIIKINAQLVNHEADQGQTE